MFHCNHCWKQSALTWDKVAIGRSSAPPFPSPKSWVTTAAVSLKLTSAVQVIKARSSREHSAPFGATKYARDFHVTPSLCSSSSISSLPRVVREYASVLPLRSHYTPYSHTQWLIGNLAPLLFTVFFSKSYISMKGLITVFPFYGDYRSITPASVIPLYDFG